MLAEEIGFTDGAVGKGSLEGETLGAEKWDQREKYEGVFEDFVQQRFQLTERC